MLMSYIIHHLRAILSRVLGFLSRHSTPRHDMHHEDVLFCVQTLRILSRRSRSARLQVACIIWDVERRTIISLGYNGTPPGEDNTMELDNVTLPAVIHAERNALSKLSLSRHHDKVLFLTHLPCPDCAAAIIARGITCVHYMDLYRDVTALKMFRASGVKVVRLLTKT